MQRFAYLGHELAACGVESLAGVVADSLIPSVAPRELVERGVDLGAKRCEACTQDLVHLLGIDQLSQTHCQLHLCHLRANFRETRLGRCDGSKRAESVLCSYVSRGVGEVELPLSTLSTSGNDRESWILDQSLVEPWAGPAERTA
ncbi:MAG: hypothetical protein ACRYHQ_01765 [Janthinobacterium lividum]